jgi:hypothetical protein
MKRIRKKKKEKIKRNKEKKKNLQNHVAEEGLLAAESKTFPHVVRANNNTSCDHTLKKENKKKKRRKKEGETARTNGDEIHLKASAYNAHGPLESVRCRHSLRESCGRVLSFGWRKKKKSTAQEKKQIKMDTLQFLVTGSRGYFGRRLVGELLRLGAKKVERIIKK